MRPGVEVPISERDQPEGSQRKQACSACAQERQKLTYFTDVIVNVKRTTHNGLQIYKNPPNPPNFQPILSPLTQPIKKRHKHITTLYIT